MIVEVVEEVEALVPRIRARNRPQLEGVLEKERKTLGSFQGKGIESWEIKNVGCYISCKRVIQLELGEGKTAKDWGKT